MHIAWALLIATFLIYTVFISPRVYYAEDDVLYQLMAKSMAEYGSLFLKNGYDEIPSALFRYMSFYKLGPDEHIVAQYPPLFGIVAAPLFKLFGTEGTFYTNALLLLLSMWMTFRIALRLFDDRALAHAAALIWGAGTFAWMYAVIATPHILSVVLVLGAFWCVLMSQDGRRKRDAADDMALLGGLLLGASVAARIDNFFSAPAVLTPVLFAYPLRWRRVFFFAYGLGAALLACAWVNGERFGIFNPFSYGPAERQGIYQYTTYYGVLLTDAALMALIFFAVQLPRVWGAYRIRILTLAFIASAILMACAPHVVWINVKSILLHLEHGPNPGGIMGKALLQSSPFLVITPLAVWLARRNGDGKKALWLAINPINYTLIFSVLGFGSYVHLYQRFQLPAIPFYAMLAAYALFRLERPSWKQAWACVGAACAAVATGIFIFGARPDNMPPFYVLMQIMPLILAALLAVCTALCMWRPSRAFRTATVSVLIFVLTWGALIFPFGDMRMMHPQRGNFAPMQRMADKVAPDSFVFVSQNNLRLIAPYLGVPGVRLAMQPFVLPKVDDAEILRVMDFYRARHFPIYTYLNDGTAAHLEELLARHGYRQIPVEPPLLKWE